MENEVHKYLTKKSSILKMQKKYLKNNFRKFTTTVLYILIQYANTHYTHYIKKQKSELRKI